MQNGGPSESDSLSSGMKTIVLLFAVFKKHSPLILKVLTEKLWVLQSAKRTLEMIAMPASPFGSMHFTCFP